MHGRKQGDAPARRVNRLTLRTQQSRPQLIAQRLIVIRRNNAAGLASAQVDVQESRHPRVHDARPRPREIHRQIMQNVAAAIELSRAPQQAIDNMLPARGTPSACAPE